MARLIKRNIILISIILFALAIYSINLHQTFFMASDTARELLRTLEIWQNREFTVIGPPLNTINNKPIEVYFGSMGYYLGITGLIVSRFDPIGSVYPNIVLTLISIPFFYILSKKFLGRNLSIISTIIYALAPTTLAFVRSYWYPNPIIPLSVFVWYLILDRGSIRDYLFAGLISGIIFNLHYLNIAPLGVFILSLLFGKDRKRILPFVAGFVVTLSPLILFEIKNGFFIIKSLLINSGGFSAFSNRILNPLFSFDVFFYIFGLGAKDFYLPNLLNLSSSIRVVLDSILGVAFIVFLLRKQNKFDIKLAIVLLTGLIIGWYFQTFELIHIRYLFSIYPLLIIMVISFLSSLHKFLPVILFIPMILLDWKMVNYKLDPIEEYYSVPTIEAVSQTIVSDNPSGKYNITENISGDARSLAFRYFLMRDATIKPQSVEKYDQIDVLYVVTPSLKKTYDDSRWEFNASGPKNIAWEKDFEDFKLYKFVK